MSGCHEEISNVRDCQGDASFTYPELLRGAAVYVKVGIVVIVPKSCEVTVNKSQS